MSIVDESLKKGSENWAKATNVAVGATITIKSTYLDDTTFDKPYIVVVGIYDPTGEEIQVRLGIQNIKRIAEILGRNEQAWIHKKLNVLGYQDYPGLGNRGVLWGASIPQFATQLPR